MHQIYWQNHFLFADRWVVYLYKNMIQFLLFLYFWNQSLLLDCSAIFLFFIIISLSVLFIFVKMSLFSNTSTVDSLATLELISNIFLCRLVSSFFFPVSLAIGWRMASFSSCNHCRWYSPLIGSLFPDLYWQYTLINFFLSFIFFYSCVVVILVLYWINT